MLQKLSHTLESHIDSAIYPLKSYHRAVILKFLNVSRLSLVTFIMSLYFLYRYWLDRIYLNQVKKNEESIGSKSKYRREFFFILFDSIFMDILPCSSDASDHKIPPTGALKLFLAAIIITDKYFNDKTFSMSYWRRVCHASFCTGACSYYSPGDGACWTVEELNYLERSFLRELNYNLNISEDCFDNFLQYLKTRLFLEEFHHQICTTRITVMTYREMNQFYDGAAWMMSWLDDTRDVYDHTVRYSLEDPQMAKHEKINIALFFHEDDDSVDNDLEWRASKSRLRSSPRSRAPSATDMMTMSTTTSVRYYVDPSTILHHVLMNVLYYFSVYILIVIFAAILLPVSLHIVTFIW